MLLEKVYDLLSDLGYPASKSVDLHLVFNDLYRKGLIDSSEFSTLQLRIMKISTDNKGLEVC